MKLYRFGYIGEMKIEEIEAEGETNSFWIIKGRREAKLIRSYPDTVWYRTPQEAIRLFIKRQAKFRNDYLRNAQKCQDKIDVASKCLLDYGSES